MSEFAPLPPGSISNDWSNVINEINAEERASGRPPKMHVSRKINNEDRIAELKAELKKKRKTVMDEIYRLDPERSPQARINAKRIEAMNFLRELSKMNKEFKKVTWMNSIEAFNAQKAINPALKGWTADATRDISNDGTIDILIYDETGELRGLNGNTLVKSKYPERKAYTEAYPRPEDRRKVYDKTTGDLKNENPQSLRAFKSSEVFVDPNNGTAVFTYGAKSGKSLTPYQIFSKIIMKDYWQALDDDKWLENVAKHLRVSFYSKLKTNVWFYIKSWAAEKLLNMRNYPQLSPEVREDLDKSPKMKRALETLLSEILRSAKETTFERFTIAFNAVMEGRGIETIKDKKLHVKARPGRLLTETEMDQVGKFIPIPQRDPYGEYEDLPGEDFLA